MVTFWAAALALTIFLYVLLDGFDLGVGMLFPLAGDERARQHLLSSISPIWDGNETWLVLAAAILFGAFPLVYSIAISAFYLPVLVMLLALILRGVAFEFRYKAGPRMRRAWDVGFVGGSYLAAFMQGVTVGAFVAELPIQDGRFVGGPLFWAQPLAVLCGVGLCLGYAMMGACWLIGKTGGTTRDFGYRVLPWLTAALLVFLILSFGISLERHLRVLDRWIQRPALIVFPLAGLLAGGGIAWGWKKRHDHLLFPCGAVIFAAAFGTLAASFLPYMVPFTITVEQAAAPLSSLTFMFWGAGVIVLPLTLIYTAAVYFIFRGRVADVDPY
jgi:cytochrome bd ubiquinol oxidase subunit II